MKDFIKQYNAYKEMAGWYMAEILAAEENLKSSWKCSYDRIYCPYGWSVESIEVYKDRIIAHIDLRDYEYKTTLELDITDRTDVDKRLAKIEEHKIKYKKMLHDNKVAAEANRKAEYEKLKKEFGE